MGIPEGAEGALGQMLRSLDVEIGQAIGEQRSRGRLPGDEAAIVLDTRSPLLAAKVAGLAPPAAEGVPAVLEGFGNGRHALGGRFYGGRYFVAGASVNEAAAVVRVFAANADERDAAEAGVRTIAGSGHTVVVAVAGPVYATQGVRWVPFAPGGSA
jgi:hypothetical protein